MGVGMGVGSTMYIYIELDASIARADFIVCVCPLGVSAHSGTLACVFCLTWR